ncbi:MAG: hypothetical protein A7316_00075 [Candidatus Altiarchaeales archaeon WOR_SM1_86-2]|nr:MAG: hypothetical protein A7316_00075 [Candidatus Altiarchaeales archaeon WOR_SM1_86-2]ODS40860.1 MAG: hypothetical protein A7315_07390 [Candidatus Altiarchaeales archaeon WOR_SM1_79]
MKIKICVDANIIISALIGGVSRNILFDSKFEFITTEFTITEVRKYLPMIAKKSGVDINKIEFALSLLPIKVYPRENYADKIKEADELIGKIDKKDVDILALALEFECYLWAEDKHFNDIKKVVRTRDFV